MARLRYESVEIANRLLDGYDRETGSWSFPRVGDFWDTVDEAHRRGISGADKRIAIVDSGFDLSMPALARASGGRTRMNNQRGGARGHGTTVALLALTVAPDAALDLYPIGTETGPDETTIVSALERIAETDAVSICLSLGMPVPRAGVTTATPGDDIWAGYRSDARWVSLNPASCPLPEHCLCRAASAVATPRRAVCAAVGNEEEGDGECEFCPALGDRVFSIGFQFERRVLKYNADTAWATPPEGYRQATLAKGSIMQPPGALGSSFATPLMAGAAALDIDIVALPALAISSQLGGQAAVPLARGRDTGALAPAEADAMIDAFLTAIGTNPHIRDLLGGNHWCVGCALFGIHLFTNAGLAMHEQSRHVEAERLLRIARRLGPRNPHAAANLGATLRARAQAEGDAGGALVAEAAALYEEAARLGARVRPAL